jgi:hypothetical protein
MKLSTYIRIQQSFLAAFVVSVALLVFSSLFVYNTAAIPANINVNATNADSPTPIPTNAATNANVYTTPVNPVNTNNNSSVTASKPPEESGYGLYIIGGVSFLTSITSLLGFISTTVLAWRKEKREVEVIRYDNEKKELELEKLKWELEKMKQAEAEKESKPKRRKPKQPE